MMVIRHNVDYLYICSAILHKILKFKVMKKEEFSLKIKEVSETLYSLVNDDGVRCDSSLYGFLFSAHMAASTALSHVNEYDRMVVIGFDFKS